PSPERWSRWPLRSLYLQMFVVAESGEGWPPNRRPSRLLHSRYLLRFPLACRWAGCIRRLRKSSPFLELFLLSCPYSFLLHFIWSIVASILASRYEHAFSFSHADRGLCPGIEVEEILFDPIAENDSVVRHLRFQRKR